MFFVIRILFLLYIIEISTLKHMQTHHYHVLKGSMLETCLFAIGCIVIFVAYNFIFYELDYCMDTTPEMSLKLRIEEVEEKIKYFQEQSIAADMDFKEVLSTRAHHEANGTLDQWVREYSVVESALKDSNSNLNSETRMLNILKAKLNSGDYNMASTSTATKRKFTD